jgi:ATP-dependent helicase/nuclease subunit A
MRTGVAANLHAFMGLALSVDSGRYPSLPRFLDELVALRRAAKQEAPDEGATGDGGNAVRIYTVHGSKGLEAPIVWLLGADSGDGNKDHYGVLLDWPPEEAAPRHFSLYGKKEERGKARAIYFDTEAALDRRENLNLLYVAMTRARQALIVSGSGSKRSGDSWYDKIARAVQDGEMEFGELKSAARQQQPQSGAAPGQEILPNAALMRSLPTGERQSTQLSEARRYGIQLHAVLEHVVPPKEIADKNTVQKLLGLSEEIFEPLWQDATQLIGAAPLRRFFQPDEYVRAYNEVSFCAEDGAVKRLDRLVEFADSVWVLDYKTREVADENDLPRAATPYRKQMREYRAAMEKVYPNKPVYCALIFKGGLLCQVGE